MKTLRILLVLSVIFLSLSSLGGSDALAQGKFSYTSGIQIMNLSGVDANITISYYAGGTGPDAGTLVTSTNRLATPGEVFFYFPIPISGSFSGSVVVASDQPIAALSNLLSSDLSAQASYVGSSTGSTSILIPLLDKGNSGWDSWFSLQNAGDGTATVNIDYGDCTTDPSSFTLLPSAAKTFYQATETCHTKKITPAQITSNQPLVAAVVRETTSVLTAYTGFAQGATKPVMTLINVQPAKAIQTGVNIQNIGSLSTDVTVSYQPSQAGTACTEKQTIPAGEMRTFALAAFVNSSNLNENCIDGSKFIGSAEVTINSASQLLTSVVTQFTPTTGAMYSGFDPASATSTVVFPTIFDRRGAQQLWTSVAVMNVGAVRIGVLCTFTNSAYTISEQLDPGKGFNYLQNGIIASNYFGAATCTASKLNGGDPEPKIVGSVNEVAGPGVPGDVFMIYEGINP